LKKKSFFERKVLVFEKNEYSGAGQYCLTLRGGTIASFGAIIEQFLSLYSDYFVKVL